MSLKQWSGIHLLLVGLSNKTRFVRAKKEKILEDKTCVGGMSVCWVGKRDTSFLTFTRKTFTSREGGVHCPKHDESTPLAPISNFQKEQNNEHASNEETREVDSSRRTY